MTPVRVIKELWPASRRPQLLDHASAGRRTRDRGATAVELAFITPLVLVVILLVVQFALWFHGRQVADAAAREGSRVARSAGDAGGWQAEAEKRATGIVRDIGPKLLRDASANAWEKGDNRGVTVEGSAVQVIPLLPPFAFTITADFGGPVECFRPDVDGGAACA